MIIISLQETIRGEIPPYKPHSIGNASQVIFRSTFISLSPKGVGNSQSSDENIFRVDNLAPGDAFFAQQMADDAETENIALSIVL